MSDSSEIVAWTYDAAMHCLTCAENHFGVAALADDQNPPKDSEGNEAHPVFASDDESGWYGETCADCERRIPDGYDWEEDFNRFKQSMSIVKPDLPGGRDVEVATITFAFEPLMGTPIGVKFYFGSCAEQEALPRHWFFLADTRADLKHQAAMFHHLADVIEQHLPPKQEVNCGPRPQC